MILLALGFIYGTGFAITLIGGSMYMVILNAFNGKEKFLKYVIAACLWPASVGYIAYKTFKYYKEYRYESQRRDPNSGGTVDFSGSPNR